MTRPALRRFRPVVVAALVLLALTGCVKVHSTTSFSSDNLVTQDLVLAVNPSLLTQLGVDASELSAESLLARVPEGAEDRVTIEDYKDGDLQGVTIHAEGLTLEEFNATTSVLSDLASGEAPEGSADAPGGGSAEEALRGISGALGGIAGASAEREGDEFIVTIPASAGGEGAVAGIGVSADQIAAAIDFAAVFTFPGPVTEATRGEVEGKRVTLDVKDLQAGGEIVIRAGAKDAIAWGPIIQWALIVLAAVVIVAGATAFILADRARRKETGLPDPADTGLEPEALPPDQPRDA
jgi:hypothetical protein